MKCVKCGKELTRDEIGLSCKLISRDARDLRCLKCLSAEFRVGIGELQAMIARFKAAGCTLFR